MLKESNLDRPVASEPSPRRESGVAAPRIPAQTGKGPWLGIIIFVVLAGLLFLGWRAMHKPAASKSAAGADAKSGARGRSGPIPVTAVTVASKDVPIYLDGLGTVQAFNTVAVRSRVDGQIQQILFTEGQDVKVGDVLAQIDPAPFQTQLDQNLAKKAEDEAQLQVANVTLKRNADLLTSKILSQQDYDTQAALVRQLEATVLADQAAVDSARVQLGYTRIVSPLEGRTGMRLVDQGNMVRAADSNGIVVISQLHPISVLFTLPEQNLSDIQPQLGSSGGLTVLAVDRNNRNTLGEGKLAVIDPQIDTSTGTIRLKATFTNENLRLWPGQFINARLLLTVREGGTVVPAQVIQRGPDGAYAFIINPDSTVAVRPVKVALIDQGIALIDEGLQPGDRVVLDNQFKLQPGSPVKVSDAPASAPGSGPGRKKTGQGRSAP